MTIQEIIQQHFIIEPGLHIVAVYQKELPAAFLLIEVNDEAFPTGRIEPFYFSPNEEFHWPIYVADVTQDEWSALQEGTLHMPDGWPSNPASVLYRTDMLNGEQVL